MALTYLSPKKDKNTSAYLRVLISEYRNIFFKSVVLFVFFLFLIDSFFPGEACLENLGIVPSAHLMIFGGKKWQ